MNTSNTFLRYFEIKDEKEVNEKFISIADLDYSGAPINDEGEDLDRDENLYRYDPQTGIYIQLK